MIAKLFKTLASLFFIILIAAIGGELWFRTFHPEPIFSNLDTSQFGNATAFRANLEQEVKFRDVSFTLKTDKRHLRTFQEINYKKADDVYRILCIGGSIFAASGVNNDETFSYFLEKILNEKIKNKRFEVVNAGKNLWELAEFFTFLKNEGKKYSPDLVVVYHHTGELGTFDLSEVVAEKLSFKVLSKDKGQISIKGINFDIRVRSLNATLLNLIQNFPGYDFFFPKSHLTRFTERRLREKLVRPLNPSNESQKNFKLFFDQPRIKQLSYFDFDTPYGKIENITKSRLKTIIFSIAFEKFSDLVESFNAKLLTLIVPSRNEILGTSLLPQELKPAPIRNKQNAIWLDLTEPLKKLQETFFFPLNYPQKIHWTPAGHQIAAYLGFNQLVSSSFISLEKQSNSLIFNFSSHGAAKIFENSNHRIQSSLEQSKYLDYLKGIIYKNRKDYSRAIKFLLAYSKHYPNAPEVFVHLGEILLEQKQPDKAIPHFLKAFELKNSKDSGVAIQLGNSYYLNGQLQEAEGYLRLAVGMDSNSYKNCYFLGNYLFLTERYQEAIAQFEKSLELNPGENLVLEALGGAYYKSGNSNKAIAVFEKILKNDSQNPSALATLEFIQKQAE